MHCFKIFLTKFACYSKNCIVVPRDYSRPIKSFLATLTNTCLVSFPDSSTVHTTTEEGLDGLGAVYNVVIEYYLTPYNTIVSKTRNNYMIQPPTALHISSQMGYHITIQDLGQNPLERLWICWE